MFTSKNPVLLATSYNVQETQLTNLKFEINILLKLNLKKITNNFNTICIPVSNIYAKGNVEIPLSIW